VCQKKKEYKVQKGCCIKGTVWCLGRNPIHFNYFAAYEGSSPFHKKEYALSFAGTYEIHDGHYN